MIWVIRTVMMFFLLTTALAAMEKTQAFNPLLKITVGPYDNFASVAAENALIYTQSKYLSNQIRSLDMQTGVDRQVVAIEGDSKSPQLSPNGKFIAFIYFMHDAKGDVCFSPTEKLEIKCFTRPNLADHSPFWISDSRIGLLSSDDFGKQSVLWSYDIQDNSKKVLLKGDIFSPSISAGGDKLLYRDGSDRINVIALSSGKKLNSYAVVLPIRIGQTVFGPNDQHIYFTGYSVDTNGDFNIDSRDHGVIYRLNVDGKKSKIIPTQLTSSAYNCSYPSVYKMQLYLTCAFSGSLDVYKTSLSGIIPEQWEKQDLLEAHQAARSYADRLVILNRLYTKASAISLEDLLIRSFFNLVLAQQWLPASNYANILAQKYEGQRRADFYALSEVLAFYASWEVDQRKSKVQEPKLSLKRRLDLMQQRHMDASKAIVEILLAFEDYMLGNNSSSFNRLLSLKAVSPIEVYFQSYLLKKTLTSIDDYRKYLVSRFYDKSALIENRIYYLSLFLDEVSSLSDAIEQIKNVLQTDVLEDEFIQLLENEILIYQVSQSRDLKVQVEFAQKSAKIARKLIDSYLFKRLLFSRSMLIYRQFGLAKQQADLASLWLSFSNKETKEYPYVIEAFKTNTMENGYNFLSIENNMLNFAKGAFFAAIRSTDDLEAHFQYVRLSAIKENKERFLNDYQLMVQDGLVSDSAFEFAQLIREIDFQDIALWPSSEMSEAIRILESLSDNANGAGIKYLLLANIYHQIVVDSVKRYAYDKAAAEKAHRYYLLAIDLSKQNDRIIGASNLNLGLLHYTIRNYTLAAEYLSSREDFKFENPKYELAYRYMFASCLYRAGRAEQAYGQIEKTFSTPHEFSLFFEKKAAFYAMAAGNYVKASEMYLRIVDQIGVDKLSGSIMLSLGFSLYKLNRDDDALVWLSRAVDYADASIGNSGKDDGVQIKLLHHEKTKFIALGLISQMKAIGFEERINALKTRMSLYSQLIDNASFYQFSSSELTSQHIKDLQRLFVLYRDSDRLSDARKSMVEAMQLTVKSASEIGYFSYAVQQAFKNAVCFQLFNDNVNDLEGEFDELYTGMQEAMKEHKTLSSEALLSFAKSTLLYEALKVSKISSKNRRGRFEAASDSLNASGVFKALKKQSEQLYKELDEYKRGLLAHL